MDLNDANLISFLNGDKKFMRLGYFSIIQGVLIFIASLFGVVMFGFPWIAEFGKIYILLSALFGVSYLSKGITISHNNNLSKKSAQQGDAPESGSSE